MTTIQIQRVSPPTEKQRESNIFGSCNLLILSETNKPIVYLNNITIRLNTKTNNKFLAPPSFKYPTANGDKHMNYFSLLPLGEDDSIHEEQRESLRALTAEVIRYAENGGKNHTAYKGGSSNTNSAPQQQASTPQPSTTSSGKKDPW